MLDLPLARLLQITEIIGQRLHLRQTTQVRQMEWVTKQITSVIVGVSDMKPEAKKKAIDSIMGADALSDHKGGDNRSIEEIIEQGALPDDSVQVGSFERFVSGMARASTGPG